MNKMHWAKTICHPPDFRKLGEVEKNAILDTDPVFVFVLGYSVAYKSWIFQFNFPLFLCKI